MCGESGAPFAGTLEIALSGDRYSPGPSFQSYNYGSKVLLVFGKLQLYGLEPSHAWTRLSNTAEAGDAEIVVQGAVDWQVGHTIVLASTSYEPSETETALITAVRNVSAANGAPATQLTLSSPLEFRHFAGVETHGGRSVSMRGEVGVLSRTISLRGTDADEAPQFRSLHIGETGAQLIVSELLEYTGGTYAEEVGEAHIVGVRVAQAGVQGYSRRPAIGFHRLGKRPVGRNVLRSCVVENSFNVGIHVLQTGGLDISSNVVYNTIGSSFRLHSRGNTVYGNLGLRAATRLTYLGRETRSTLTKVAWADYLGERLHESGSSSARHAGSRTACCVCPPRLRLRWLCRSLAHVRRRSDANPSPLCTANAPLLAMLAANFEFDDTSPCAGCAVMNISANAAAGSERLGFKFSGPAPSECAGTSGGSVFASNTAHTNQLGFAVHFAQSAPCVEIRSLTLWRSWTMAVWGSVGTSPPCLHHPHPPSLSRL